MPFGIDTNAMIDRAMAQLGPIIERALGQFATAVAQLDASIDALTNQQAASHAEAIKGNALLRQLLIEARKPGRHL